MNTKFTQSTALVGLCLLLLVMQPGSALAQEADPPIQPTPEPVDSIPEAPVPDMDEDFFQELSSESLPDEFSIMAVGIARRVADIWPGSYGSYPAYLQVFNNKLFFGANGGGGAGQELWVYDGSSDPYRMADIYSGSGSSNPAHLQVFNNKLYFGADNGVAGRELWVYSGSGTPSLAADIYPGVYSSNPDYLVVFNGKLYFSAAGADGMGYELWAYDGSNPPSRVADIYSGSNGSYPAYLRVFNGKLYFSADGGDFTGRELWAYDGVNPPKRVADIWLGSSSSYPEFLQVFNNKLYFQANGGGGAGWELWTYNGFNPPYRVADIYPGSGSSYPGFLQVFNNELYFAANGGDGAGSELWTYDGSHPPYRAADIYPGIHGSEPAVMRVFNNKLYFAADGGDGTGRELQVYSPLTTHTFTSPGVYDGWALESSEFSNKGGSMNSTATTFRLGDDAQDRQYRAILHFNTFPVPANAVITKVQLKIKRYSIIGTNPFNTHGNLYADIKKGAFSGPHALQLADFQTPASKSAAGKFSITPVSYWYTLTLPAANFGYINKIGVTQFRLRFSKDDNDDRSTDYINFISGNIGNFANRPKLVVTYYVP